jgi:cytochrome c-type biogenesis protein CcmF
MVGNIGFGVLVITFLISIYGIFAALYGIRIKSPAWVESARHAMLLTWPLLTITSLSIIYLLVTGAYEYEYVTNVTSDSMPTYLKVTALWGGQSGSLVFWSWLMAAFVSAVTIRKWDRDRELLPWVTVVSLVTLSFFLMLILFIENPFARLWQTPIGEITPALFQPPGASLFSPPDGRGLNPLLRHPGMVIHPPMLYLGFVSFVIPYAFAIAALVTGRTDDRWIRITRRWTLYAWMFLSLGLILGGRWAYDVLGWGGYWGWDPVEISSFMPWLTGTAFLHSVMIQEKQGMFKRWNMILIILTYDLMIFGTFLTRSGVLSSVHAFAQSAIGPLFFGFIAVTFIVSIALLFYRWDSLKSERELSYVLSRESFFVLNNLLFIGITAICFLGVIFPLLSELFTGQKVTVGPAWYERTTGPLWISLLILMGIAPLAAWRRTTARKLGASIWLPTALSFVPVGVMLFTGDHTFGSYLGVWASSLVAFVTLNEFWKASVARSKARNEFILSSLWTLFGRNRRRYGGYVIHLGVVLMAIGIIGIEVYQTETQGTIPVGETLTLGDYMISYDKLDDFDTADQRNVARAVVSVYKDGEFVGELYPRRDFFYESQQPMTIPGVRSTLEDDFYVLLIDWQPISTQQATFKIYHNPLVNWVWLGGLVFVIGTIVAAWPEKDRSARQIEVRDRRVARGARA